MAVDRLVGQQPFNRPGPGPGQAFVHFRFLFGDMNMDGGGGVPAPDGDNGVLQKAGIDGPERMGGHAQTHVPAQGRGQGGGRNAPRPAAGGGAKVG